MIRTVTRSLLTSLITGFSIFPAEYPIYPAPARTMHPLEMHTTEFSRQLALPTESMLPIEPSSQSAPHYTSSSNACSSNSSVSADSFDEESPDDLTPAPRRSAKRLMPTPYTTPHIQILLNEFNKLRQESAILSSHLEKIGDKFSQLIHSHATLLKEQEACSAKIQLLLNNQQAEDAVLSFYNEQHKLIKQFKQQIAPVIPSSNSSSSSSRNPHDDNVDITSLSSDPDSSDSYSSSSTSHRSSRKNNNTPPQLPIHRRERLTQSSSLPTWSTVYNTFKCRPPKEAIEIINSLIETTKNHPQSDEQQHRLNLLYLSRVRFYITLHREGQCDEEIIRTYLNRINPKTFQGRTIGNYKEFVREFNAQNNAKRQRR